MEHFYRKKFNFRFYFIHGLYMSLRRRKSFADMLQQNNLTRKKIGAKMPNKDINKPMLIKFNKMYISDAIERHIAYKKNEKQDIFRH